MNGVKIEILQLYDHTLYSRTTIGYSLNEKQKIENSKCPKLPIFIARFQVYQYAKFGYKY